MKNDGLKSPNILNGSPGESLGSIPKVKRREFILSNNKSIFPQDFFNHEELKRNVKSSEEHTRPKRILLPNICSREARPSSTGDNNSENLIGGSHRWKRLNILGNKGKLTVNSEFGIIEEVDEEKNKTLYQNSGSKFFQQPIIEKWKPNTSKGFSSLPKVTKPIKVGMKLSKLVGYENSTNKPIQLSTSKTTTHLKNKNAPTLLNAPDFNVDYLNNVYNQFVKKERKLLNIAENEIIKPVTSARVNQKVPLKLQQFKHQALPLIPSSSTLSKMNSFNKFNLEKVSKPQGF